MSLTSVFGMAASPSAASGGSSEGAASAAVDKIEDPHDAMILSGTANGNRWTPTV